MSGENQLKFTTAINKLNQESITAAALSQSQYDRLLMLKVPEEELQRMSFKLKLTGASAMKRDDEEKRALARLEQKRAQLKAAPPDQQEIIAQQMMQENPDQYFALLDEGEKEKYINSRVIGIFTLDQMFRFSQVVGDYLYPQLNVDGKIKKKIAELIVSSLIIGRSAIKEALQLINADPARSSEIFNDGYLDDYKIYEYTGDTLANIFINFYLADQRIEQSNKLLAEILGNEKNEQMSDGGKLDERRCKNASFKIAKAYQQYLNNVLPYEKYEKIVAATKIPKDKLSKIEIEVSKNKEFRPIDIYQFWSLPPDDDADDFFEQEQRIRIMQMKKAKEAKEVSEPEPEPDLSPDAVARQQEEHRQVMQRYREITGLVESFPQRTTGEETALLERLDHRQRAAYLHALRQYIITQAYKKGVREEARHFRHFADLVIDAIRMQAVKSPDKLCGDQLNYLISTERFQSSEGEKDGFIRLWRQE